MPCLGLARVDGALYGFCAKCEAFRRRKSLCFSGRYKNGEASGSEIGRLARISRDFQPKPGGMPPPGIPRSIFFMPPLDIFFIIFSICRCCFNRRLTS